MAEPIACPSPNFAARPPGAVVSLLVIHYTGMASTRAALARLCDPAAKVSTHYLIDESGRVLRLVAERERAWHAGVSHWRGEADVNSRSIGIELAHPGHMFGYRPFPPAQIRALIALGRQILRRHPIRPRGVLGHSDVAPARRLDPGEYFPWRHLAENGIGLWPDASARGTTVDPTDPAAVQAGLARFGYGLRVDGIAGPETGSVVRAFQRHFRPRAVTGAFDHECARILASLLAVIGPEDGAR